VGKTTIMAVIDSGADINYVNEEWCNEKRIPYKMTGWGWIKGYSGEKVRTKILEARIGIKVQGKYSRVKFSVLKETGDDKLVLGIPWLEKANPVIDWRERTIKFHGNNDGSSWSPMIRMVDSEEANVTKVPSDPNERKKPVKISPTIEEEQPDTDENHSAAYYAELQEIRGKLPVEIRDFADVFCSKD
jgi:hypothetical protein